MGERRNAVERVEREVTTTRGQHEQTRVRLAEISRLFAESNARLEELAHGEAAGREHLSAIRAEMSERKTRAEESAAAMLEAASRVEARRARLGAIEQELGHLRRLADELEAQMGSDRAALARLGDERASNWCANSNN